MKKVFTALLTGMAFLGICLANSDRLETIYNPQLTVVHFLPGGQNGIYNKGEEISFRLLLNSQEAADAEIEFDAVDYYGEKVSSGKLTQTLEAGKNCSITIPVKDPGKFGHFTLESKIRLNGKLAVTTQSAFAVIPPPLADSDPYFVVDGRNPHGEHNMTLDYKRIGFECIAVSTGNYTDPAYYCKSYFNDPKRTRFKHVDGVFSIGTTDLLSDKSVDVNQESGFYPFSNDFYGKFDQVVRTCAEHGKGEVHTWMIVQEVEAHMALSKFSPVAVMTDHVIRVKRAAKILREVDPDCKIAVINSCGDDFFSNDFRIVRMLLKETAAFVDYFGIDAYSGTWNGLLSDLEPPEKDDRFKTLLQASIRIAVEFQLAPKIIQAERGYLIPYLDALNSPKTHDMTNFNVRSMIIARSIPGVMKYSLHGGCQWYLPYSFEKYGRKPENTIDHGMWRSVYDVNKKFALQPRPGTCAIATVIRMLSYVEDPQEIRITRGIHSVNFRRTDGQRVVALWSVDQTTRASLVFPAGAELTDLMGNTTKLSKGTNVLSISQAPCFIVLQADADALASMLKNAVFPDIKSIAAFARPAAPGASDMHLLSLSNQDQNITLQLAKDQQGPDSVMLKAGERKTIRIYGKSGFVRLLSGQQQIELQVPYQEPVEVKPGSLPQSLALLKYPDNIYPIAALRAERNLFRCDGTDISADFAASWDSDSLYLQFTVQDATHLQRQTGSSIWKDDCVQFGIDAGNNALPQNMGVKYGYDDDDYVFGLALMNQAPLFYAWRNGKKSAGTLDFKTSIVHKNGVTTYNTVIPWLAIPPLKPVKGTAFGFSFIIMDNNELSFRSAPYWLGWTEGIAGKQDPSKFKTLILQ